MNSLFSRVKSCKLATIAFVFAALAFLFVFYGMAINNTPESNAVSAQDFKAGRIIDDEVFYNPDTMTVAEIQAHLDKYSANCDMWGTNKIGYGRYINGKAVDPNITRREYARLMREAGRTDYHDAPFVCISKYYENPTTHKTNFETNAQPEEGMISAAQIIYDAAHAYNINPQVLLVMLKKESYVWGDTWPLKNEYNTVMGYACPDNAPCDSAYFGFYNQVMKAAWQLNYYKEHIYSYGYYPYMTNNIYYSPNYACGTKAVYLENIATTSLYIYTPYTPNDAALANYPGEAYCGSYGNRNFFMYFSEWFGSPTAFNLQRDVIENYAKGHDYFGEAINGGEKCKGSICMKEYEFGYVLSENKNVWDIHGGIFQKWKELSAEKGILGLPVGSEVYESDKVVYQVFEKGRIYWIEDKAVTMHGGIYSYWLENDGDEEKLGYPISAEYYDLNGNVSQKYTKSTIFWNKKDGSWSVGNELLDYWLSIGGAESYLGTSIAPPKMLKMNNGISQEFVGGHLYWSTNTGTWDIHGAILKKWIEQGGEEGSLGYPKSAEKIDAEGKTFQDFENGRVYWKNDMGIWVFKNTALDFWMKAGKDKGYLGTPIDYGQCGLLRGTCYQMFSGGRLYWSSDNGVHAVHGGILGRWAAEGLEWGKLGFPIGDEVYENGHVYQEFEGGRIYWNNIRGTWVQ